MTRRNAEEDRRPRRFDPKQRGRDHTRTRSRRKRGQTEQVTERRVDQLESWWHMTTSVATQAAATTLIEVVTELPDATYLDIGRQIILRSPSAVHDILYVGMQMQDDAVAWIQWTSSYEDSPNSPEFSWSQHYSFGASHRAVFLPNQPSLIPVVYFLRDGQNMRDYPYQSGGAGSSVALIPTSGNSGYSLYTEGSAGTLRIWVAVPGLGKVQYFNGSSVVASAATQNFWALRFDTAGSRLVLTDRSNNRCTTMHKTTLAVLANFATDCSAPEGIAADSSGNIYVADTGNNRIRKYNSSLVHQLNWGSAGSADGQFNAPKGMVFDAADRLYVCDSGNNRVQVFSTSGVLLGKFGIGGSGGGQLSNPNDISILDTNIVVNDFGNNRLSFWTRM